MTRPKSKKISKQKVLLVEGRDEEELINKILRRADRTDVEIFQSEGKDNINRAIGAMKFFEGFDDVTHFGVIRDADGDANAAFTSVQHGLRQHGLPMPDAPSNPNTVGALTTSVLILPGNGQPGMLETLVWRTVETTQIAQEAETFLTRCRGILPPADNGARPDGPDGWRAPRNVDKARICALLSTMIDPQGRMGIAAQQNYFDLQHQELRPLTDYIAAL
ncbi:DUF3226 domain-containing protein [Burkholderia sp. USMB20]|uniref:DUF3226 domain-containing protein n=1 Tax=Burkholderia sp. USMB20 TaxID=1571773 RepID=UPI000AC6A188|nr:DUF3226 domain-containing protein [Burkholderia sp. USMB20]TGN96474.1 hypothetical protein PL79_013840 [Burkholderia sp. USMB20]